MDTRIPLNDNWEFFEDIGASGSGEEGPSGLRPGGGETVRLPHTFKLVPYDYFDESVYQMVGAYRRTLEAPAEWSGKTVLLRIGTAAHYAEVFLNGKKIAEHRCGYTAFTVDLSEGIRPGEENVLAIKVDSRETLDQPPFGNVIDYMTYGGLYREVWLEVREAEHIEALYPAAVVETAGGAARGRIDISARLTGLRGPGNYELVFTAEPLGAADKAVQGGAAPGALVPAVVRCPVSADKSDIKAELTLNSVLLWDVDDPKLYTFTAELLRDGEIIDREERRIGFRSAYFDAEGFHLNGRLLKLRGLNRHQSYPYVGYAAPASLQRYDAEILKNELGLNAVRTSHYPQSQHFIDRCDELGLLVFTEIPGWQYIGGEDWKKIALENVREMVEQYRDHPSIILWGVRINESVDDDGFYEKTNALAHSLDPYRQTSGVRYLKKSSLLEDVYAYNDFSHDGTNPGCEPKDKVTSDPAKGYLISEYNGHMYPTKAFDSEYHRLDHLLRHARVLNDAAAAEGIAGSFGWAFADYNTHRDFGSGDRICYHGVLDMFRNPKPAAYVYAAQQETSPVLFVSSHMDIGEHPTGNPGTVYIVTNADSVKMYRGDDLLREYTGKDSEFGDLAHGPILITDYVGDRVRKGEGWPEKKTALVRDILNYSAVHGSNHLPLKIMLNAARAMVFHRLGFADAYALYGKYIGGWGDARKDYRFEAYRDGRLVASLIKSPSERLSLSCLASSAELVEGDTYDMALVRVRAIDRNGGLASFFNEPVELSTEGPIEIVGPHILTLRGGMGGLFVRTAGLENEEAGSSVPASLTLTNPQTGTVTCSFSVLRDRREDR